MRTRIADAFRRHGVRSAAHRYTFFNTCSGIRRTRLSTRSTEPSTATTLGRRGRRFITACTLVDAGLARAVKLAGDASRFESYVEPTIISYATNAAESKTLNGSNPRKSREDAASFHIAFGK